MSEAIEALRSFMDGDIAATNSPELAALCYEQNRQYEKLILIPSESIAPKAVQQALGTVFTNIYAEGYPSLRTLVENEAQLGDIDMEMALHRRFADRRHYRGTEMANVVEALAASRVARLFATDRLAGHGAPVPADSIFANVQPLSGAAANNAVYEALLQPGDTILGMNLTHGGHLTHGSPYNRSGKYFKVFQYGVSPETGRIDYDEIERLAQEHRPRLIVVGASAYPWTFDWPRLRAIADGTPVRTLLMADMAHPAGLIVGGQFPNPIGYAHVVTFTTHKTMLGPRGAVILSTSGNIAKRIDRAVFPGEQGGPHVNNTLAMAVAFRLAGLPAFREIQARIISNAAALAQGLQQRGVGLAYGGTNTHLMLIDLKQIKSPNGQPITGDVAARILDMCDIVCNKNTIPGDLNASRSTAIRVGTVWLTQRGADAEHMDRLAEIIAGVLNNIRPFYYVGAAGEVWRGKVDYPVLKEATDKVASLVDDLTAHANEHHIRCAEPEIDLNGPCTLLEVRGPRAAVFLQEALTAQVIDLPVGEARPALALDANGELIASVVVTRDSGDEDMPHFLLAVATDKALPLRDWLRSLSDGYTVFEPDDLEAKISGPVVIAQVNGSPTAVLDRARLQCESLAKQLRPSGAVALNALATDQPQLVQRTKPYFIGRSRLQPLNDDGKARFMFNQPEGELKRSCLYEEHLKLTAARNLVPFAGWSMPVWYTSISEEHTAVRETAGLFDVTHMGIIEVRGKFAARFLDLVTSNYVCLLKPGQTQYGFLLDPAGAVIDDILTYCLEVDRFMLVVNAANHDKDLAWLRAVNQRSVLIDYADGSREVDVTVDIRDLKEAAAGADQLVDIAIQGPRSLAIMRRAMPDDASKRAVGRLRRSEFMPATIDGVSCLVSRTGYTGEQFGYEIYLHPDKAPQMWNFLLREGESLGLRPTGLGSRDSSRTEAGLPLYGHELAGEYNVSPSAAGYGSFVRLHKPFFIGRDACKQAELERKLQIIRFAVNAKGVRMFKGGDPVVTKRGEAIGYVTSSVAVKGAQVGLALVDKRHSEPGTVLGVISLPREGARAEKPKTELQPGDRVLLHEDVTVLERFMVSQQGQRAQ